MFQSLVDRFASHIKVLANTATGLVEAVEAGNFNSSETRKIIEKGIMPMLEQGADTIVLGCTHFPLVLPLIRDVAGEGVRIIEPATAIAKRTAYLIENKKIKFSRTRTPEIIFSTTGDIEKFRTMVVKITNEYEFFQKLRWEDRKLINER